MWVLLLLPLLSVAAVQDGCPDGYHYASESSCFRILPEEQNWYNALHDCAYRSGGEEYLARFETLQEFEQVRSFIKFGETDVITETVCYDSSIQISCTHGQTITFVHGESGQISNSSSFCNSPFDTASALAQSEICHLDIVTALNEECEGMQECTLPVTYNVFTDHCSDVPVANGKYIEFGWKCMYAADKRFWTAGNDITRDEYFRWAPHDIPLSDAVVPMAWAKGPTDDRIEPNNLRNRERCINVHDLANRDYYFNDACCDINGHPICMIAKPPPLVV